MTEWPSRLKVAPGKATWLLHPAGSGVRGILGALIDREVGFGTRTAFNQDARVAWWDPEWQGYGTREGLCVDATRSVGLEPLGRVLEAVLAARPGAPAPGGLAVIMRAGLLPSTGKAGWAEMAAAAAAAAASSQVAVVVALQLPRSSAGLDLTPFTARGHVGLVLEGGDVAVLS